MFLIHSHRRARAPEVTSQLSVVATSCNCVRLQNPTRQAGEVREGPRWGTQASIVRHTCGGHHKRQDRKRQPRFLIYFPLRFESAVAAEAVEKAFTPGQRRARLLACATMNAMRKKAARGELLRRRDAGSTPRSRSHQGGPSPLAPGKVPQ